MLYRGDDTNAFGQKFMTIELENCQGLVITKAELQCGTVHKTFENPTFPLDVDLCCDETKVLLGSNCCYLCIYDEQGRKHTCKGEVTITTKKGVV